MYKIAEETTSTFESQLFKAAGKLRKNIDAAEYKNVVLGLIFPKYISDSFEALYRKLQNKKNSSYDDLEDRDEYIAQNIFFVPQRVRWTTIQSRAKLPTIWLELDQAMDVIEKENPQLKNVLPKVFGRLNLDVMALGGWLILFPILNSKNGARILKIFLEEYMSIFWESLPMLRGKSEGNSILQKQS